MSWLRTIAVNSSRNLTRRKVKNFLDMNSGTGKISCQYFSTTPKFLDTFNVQDEADFKQKVIQSKKPVVVDFHATWCPPCKTLMPRLETVIAATNDGVDLAKVDIDELPDIAMEYGVGAVPSVLSFKGGEVFDKFVGVRDEDELKTFVDNLRK